MGLIYQAKGSAPSHVPQWKKELFKLLPLLARKIRTTLNSGLPGVTHSTEGLPSRLPKYMVDAMRLGLGSDRVRPGTIPTGMSEATSIHTDGSRSLPFGLFRRKTAESCSGTQRQEQSASSRAEDTLHPRRRRQRQKHARSWMAPSTFSETNESPSSTLYQSLRSDDDVALMGTAEAGDTYLRVIDILFRMYAKNLCTLKCLLIATKTSISHIRAKSWKELEELITTVQIHKQEDVFNDIRCYIISRTGKPRSKIEAARMALKELRDTRQDTAEYWADYQHKTNKLKNLGLRIARCKAGDISAAFHRLIPRASILYSLPRVMPPCQRIL